MILQWFWLEDRESCRKQQNMGCPSTDRDSSISSPVFCVSLLLVVSAFWGLLSPFWQCILTELFEAGLQKLVCD